MTLEMEELVAFFKRLFNPASVKESHYYAFYVHASDTCIESPEGMIGELKKSI